MGFPFFMPAYLPGQPRHDLRLPRHAGGGVPPAEPGARRSRWTSRGWSAAHRVRAPRARAELRHRGAPRPGEAPAPRRRLLRLPHRAARQGGGLLHRLRAQAGRSGGGGGVRGVLPRRRPRDLRRPVLARRRHLGQGGLGALEQRGGRGDVPARAGPPPLPLSTTSRSSTTSASPGCWPRRAASRRSRGPITAWRSWPPTTAWRSRSEGTGLSVDRPTGGTGRSRTGRSGSGRARSWAGAAGRPARCCWPRSCSGCCCRRCRGSACCARPRSTPTRASTRESRAWPRSSSSPSTRKACGSMGSGRGREPGWRESWERSRPRGRPPSAWTSSCRSPTVSRRPGCPRWWPGWTPTWRSGSRVCRERRGPGRGDARATGGARHRRPREPGAGGDDRGPSRAGALDRRRSRALPPSLRGRAAQRG